MAEGQPRPRPVAPVDCKECARQFPTFKVVFPIFYTHWIAIETLCTPFQVYIKHLLAKECGAAQSQHPSIKVILLPLSVLKKSVITG